MPLDTRADQSESVIREYVSMAIQGDLSGAKALFDSNDIADDPVIAALGEQFENRFHDSEPAAHDEGFQTGVISAYRAYWRERLIHVASTDSAESRLKERLETLLALHTDVRTKDPDVWSNMRIAYREEGLGFYDSPDPPLRDLFLWQEETERRYSVRLTDGAVDLEVRFLDDLLLQGWKDYASLGLATTTGWVDDGVLYCLGWAYDQDDENFRVSYLKHEARHLVDLQRWPDLGSTDLEYRAKLTELAFANRSMRRLLDDFSSKAAHNPASPHAMANWRVVRDVHWELFNTEMPDGFDGWGSIRTGKVNRAARKLLAQHTERLEEPL